uniref:Beta-lactamase-like protein 2 homolog n=1 Tax=Acrobeloides nanus TaxID=290746 RepID=A0A914CLZ0_9BILA
MTLMSLWRNPTDYLLSTIAYFGSKVFKMSSGSNLSHIEPISQLSPLVTRVLGQNPGPYTLQGTNTYLVGSGKNKILIDTGEPNITKYTENLKLALCENSIQCIIATHYHHDHVGGIPDVRKLVHTDIPVYKIRIGDEDHKEDTSLYHYVEDGHEFSTEGATLKIVYTPGHTTDHAAILLKEEHAIFSGDCILGEGTTIFSCLHTYMKSLSRLLELRPSKIYPGHGPVIEKPNEKIEDYIKHRNQREAQILEVLSDGNPITGMDIVNRVYQDIPFSVKFGALMNVKQHLKKLEKDKKVQEVETDLYQIVS